MQHLQVYTYQVWANPRPLAATWEIAVAFFSGRYLDVSVPSVVSVQPMYSAGSIPRWRDGLPHSEISGSRVVCTSPELIAAYHVLHRLLVPRHPPFALSSLTKNLITQQMVSGSMNDKNAFAATQIVKEHRTSTTLRNRSELNRCHLAASTAGGSQPFLLRFLNGGADRDRTDGLAKARSPY